MSAYRVSSRGNHFGGGGVELQEMGMALYTFLYNCPKLWGGGEASPPLDETLCICTSTCACTITRNVYCILSLSISLLQFA